jgi:endoribonuclease L-PSP, putative
MKTKTRIESHDAPAALGPYSQAVKVGNTVYLSGQLPIVPETGALIGGGIAEQTAQVLHNANAVLAEAGCTFDNVVKTTVFLADMADFPVMNEVYGKYFDVDVKPARSTVEVGKIALGALVEIDFIATM